MDPSNVRTLYIDRDPATFQDIARHLQGIMQDAQATTRAHESLELTIEATTDGAQAIMFDLEMAHNSSSYSPTRNSTPVSQ